MTFAQSACLLQEFTGSPEVVEILHRLGIFLFKSGIAAVRCLERVVVIKEEDTGLAVRSS